MSMTETERVALGERAQEVRRVRFGSSKKRVYDAAEVNPATLDRVEAGERVRGDRLAAVVRTLWPESEGDWRRVLAPGSTSTTTATQGLDAYSDLELLREVVRRMEGREATTPHGASSTTSSTQALRFAEGQGESLGLSPVEGEHPRQTLG